MGKYRKKPVVIDAIQLNEQNVDAIKDFCGDSIVILYSDSSLEEGKLSAMVKTLEGTMIAKFNDYIIKGVNGEFYPCKPDIFEKTYEPVGGC